MEHPKIENINRSIVQWVEENFKKAILPHHVDRDKFKFVRVSMISKAWMEKEYWIVDAVIEYTLRGEAQLKTITFQINKEGKIIGYDLQEPKISG